MITETSRRLQSKRDHPQLYVLLFNPPNRAKEKAINTAKLLGIPSALPVIGLQRYIFYRKNRKALADKSTMVTNI